MERTLKFEVESTIRRETRAAVKNFSQQFADAKGENTIDRYYDYVLLGAIALSALCLLILSIRQTFLQTKIRYVNFKLKEPV